MLADLAEPVPGVARVGLLPVHDGMPVASLLGLEILRHAVRVLPAGKVEIQSRQHGWRQFRRLQPTERIRRTARPARQWHQPLTVSIQRQNACDFVTIRVWIEHSIHHKHARGECRMSLWALRRRFDGSSAERPMQPSVLMSCAVCWRAWVLRCALEAVITLFRKTGVQEMINLQRDGAQAKPYQVKQVRAVILKARLGGGE